MEVFGLKGEKEEYWVSKQTIANIYGCTTTNIEYFTKNQIISHNGGRPAKYELISTAKKLFEYQRELIESKEKGIEAKKAEELKLNGEARIKQAKAEIEELKLKELRGELHRAEDIEALVTDHALYIRSMLLAMPGKLAVDIAGLGTAAEISARIRKEVYYILECASEYKYDPEEYARRVREREGWKEVTEDEED